MRPAFAAFAVLLALLPSTAARADGFDEGQAKSRMEAAGYGEVSAIHQGNLGEWMAQATRDGRPVMIVLHPDGSVALRQRTDVPPPRDPSSPGALSPAKP